MSLDAPQPSTQPPPGPLRQAAVYLTVAGTVLLAVGLMVVTGIRWMLQPTPSSIVVIVSSPRLAGASIIVQREGEKPRPPVIIPKDSDGMTPLFLETGSYIIRVEKDRRTVYRTDRAIYVAAGRRYDIDLANNPTTRP